MGRNARRHLDIFASWHVFELGEDVVKVFVAFGVSGRSTWDTLLRFFGLGRDWLQDCLSNFL